MLGEVGLDGGARLRWPVEARDLYEEKSGRTGRGEDEADVLGSRPESGGKRGSEDGESEAKEGGSNGVEEEEWKRLTPFKTSMTHQRAILEAQLHIAVELGVNVSFHSVSAAGTSPPSTSTAGPVHLLVFGLFGFGGRTDDLLQDRRWMSSISCGIYTERGLWSG